MPEGVTKAKDDNIGRDLSVGPATGRMQSASGYGHPTCSPGAVIAQGSSDQLPTGSEG